LKLFLSREGRLYKRLLFWSNDVRFEILGAPPTYMVGYRTVLLLLP
jgi:hypothetical protein